MGVDARDRFYEKDYANISRQIIAVVSIIFTSIKMVCSILKKHELRAVIDQVNSDYEKYNRMPGDYQKIIDESIALTRKVDKVWHGVLYATAVSYPSLAVVSTIYSQLFSDSPERFMFHEVRYWFVDMETQYSTPFFEYFNIYELYIIFIVTFGFLVYHNHNSKQLAGYDSSFIIFMFHAALKLKLIYRDLVHLLDDMDVQLMRAKVAKFVREHLECRLFVENIQKSFEVWLAGIFCHGVLQLGMALTQTTSQESKGGTGSNLTYYFYVMATVLHIFLPCFLASELRKLEENLAKNAYDCSWEDVPDRGVRRAIMMIIHRTQKPDEFTAIGMITFNMELFVSVLQTSYSMYTLLRN
ncbi:odorant receptor 2a-like [Aricia agestis]|uniref:odorant receptor 2a-like n=1 Tax=Aricia agestis TaxID=91739 RepID=UPI001C2099BE|nr:odorant receptor 2a-like [Aricia agestis]